MAVPLPFDDPRPAVTLEDGMRYVEALYNEFAFTEPQKYEAIVAILRAFTTGRMNNAAVVACMEDLLSSHRDLLHRFNKFLPWRYLRAHGPAGGNNH